jgi:hypothetical protein
MLPHHLKILNDIDATPCTSLNATKRNSDLMVYMLPHHLKIINDIDATPCTPLNATKQNFDHEMTHNPLMWHQARSKS